VSVLEKVVEKVKILDPRQPRRTRNPLGKRGPGRPMICMACGHRFNVVGRVPKDALVGCPHCGFEQEPDL
jgi:hypothetical protein